MARISKIYRIVISSLLALLGFSCFNGIGTGKGNGGYAEYGTPRATYKAKGVVVSKSDDSPIEGIRAELKNDSYYFHYPVATAFTDSDGFFFLEGDAFPSLKIFFVELTDVDGEENGLFAVKRIDADYTNKTFTGSSGNWYDGEAEIDLGIIKMKPE